MRSRQGGITGVAAVLVTVLIGLISAAPSWGADPSEGLDEAEAQASSAEVQLSEAEAKLGPSRQRYAAADQLANRASAAAETTRGQVEEIETALVKKRQRAAENVVEIEADHAQAVEDHDDEAETGLGIALAALLTAGIAIFWSRFRASPPVTRLVELSKGRAAGLCVGGGVGLIIVGTIMTSAGAVLNVLGTCILFLGFILPVAALLARHSAQVERDREKPVFKRKRLPRWVALSIAVVALLLFAGGLSDGVLDEPPEEPVISAELQEEAELAEGDPAEPATQGLLQARARAEQLEEKAEEVADPRDEAARILAEVRQQLRNGRRQLSRAQREARLYTRRLIAISQREAREAAAAEARELEEIEDAEAELPPIESESSYESCATAPSDIPVPPGSPLDGDGDGIGCES